MSLKNLKAGDKVFVVNQKRRHSEQEPGEEHIIVRVGRKYAYIERHKREYPFCRETGYSVHKEFNERANGYGFDVYLSLDEYLEKQRVIAEASRLKERLGFNWGEPIKLPPKAIDEIHKVLDENGCA